MQAIRSSTRACRPRTSRTALSVRASEAETWAFEKGQRVKVIKPLKVYHVPKTPQGFELLGREGTVVSNEALYKGKVLSPNDPFKVQFNFTDAEGKEKKVLAHLSDDELELIS